MYCIGEISKLYYFDVLTCFNEVLLPNAIYFAIYFLLNKYCDIFPGAINVQQKLVEKNTAFKYEKQLLKVFKVKIGIQKCCAEHTTMDFQHGDTIKMLKRINNNL